RWRRWKMPAQPWPVVMYRSGGLLFRKYGRYPSVAQARAGASDLRRSGVTDEAIVVGYVVEAHGFSRPEVLGVYADVSGEEETARYYRLQNLPYVLPPESPADDLGEEL